MRYSIAILAVASVARSQPVDYTITCAEKFELDNLQCTSVGHSLVPDVVCCRYFDQCGDLERCSEDICCSLTVGQFASTDAVTSTASLAGNDTGSTSSIIDSISVINATGGASTSISTVTLTSTSTVDPTTTATMVDSDTLQISSDAVTDIDTTEEGIDASDSDVIDTDGSMISDVRMTNDDSMATEASMIIDDSDMSDDVITTDASMITDDMISDDDVDTDVLNSIMDVSISPESIEGSVDNMITTIEAVSTSSGIITNSNTDTEAESDAAFEPDLDQTTPGKPDPELIDNTITCAVKEFEAEFTCAEGSAVAGDTPCCRWHNACDGLPRCSGELCCMEGIAPSPSPSPVPILTGEYLTTCGSFEGITCDEGNEVLADTECCEFEGGCGDGVQKCRSGLCCANSIPELITTTTESATVITSVLNDVPVVTQTLGGGEDPTAPEVQTAVNRPDVPASARDACTCGGAIIDGVCVDNLAAAIEGANDDDVVFIGGRKAVDSPIRFSGSITLHGVACSGVFPTLTATFDSKDGAILEATNDDSQKISLIDLRLTGTAGKRSAGFHTQGDVEDAGSQRVELVLSNVFMYDMTSERPGVGVFVGNSAGLVIDDDCNFKRLTMSTSDQDRYAGGAALAVVFLDESYTMSISGVFEDNRSVYPGASLHSGGGAVYFDYMSGDVSFRRGVEFRNNQANQGGAIHVQDVRGHMSFNGLYLNNQANDDGFGSRGGALRLQKLSRNARVDVVGTFRNNVAQGRGGVVATNVHLPGSELVFKGDFSKNTASTLGGVWSYWSSVEMDGRVVFNGECDFAGNRAIQDEDTSIYDMANTSGDEAKFSEADWEGETVVVD